MGNVHRITRRLCVLAALAVFTTASGQSKIGTTAVPFLGIHVGPRAVSMGGASAAVGGDASGLYYNPGSLSRSASSQFYASYSDWLVDTRFTWMGAVIRLGESAFGLSLTQLDYGEEDVTTVLQPDGTGEKWGARDMAVALTYAHNLTDRFSLGGSVKMIQTRVWNERASAFALDIGLLFRTQFHDMKLGMSISNFGTDLRMDGRDLYRRIDLDPDASGNNEAIVSRLKTDDWPLPLFFRVGLSLDVIRAGDIRWTLACDALRPSDNTETVHAGTEIALYDRFFLRSGYKSLFREDSEEGLTLGCGVHVPSGGRFSLCLDYTYADFGLFKDIQMMAIGIQF
ncbi:PorV/PorQ family protein [bacterium]|nr:PorV/PorQ family protein [bacterium]